MHLAAGYTPSVRLATLSTVKSMMPGISGSSWQDLRISLLGAHSLLTLGAHAQRGLRYLVRVLVCLSVPLPVCLFVYIRSQTTGYETAHE